MNYKNEEMEMPTPCVHCGETFDLNDGDGSEKWHENTIICADCYRNEEKEIEEDDRWETINIHLTNALYSLDKEENLKNRLDKDNLELLEKIFPLITNQNTVGIQLISAERQKQIEKHGFTAEHHVNHPEWYDQNQLIYAANVLAKQETRTPWTPANWDQRWFNNLVERPHRDRLIIAGALIAAELDRLDLIDKNSADGL